MSRHTVKMQNVVVGWSDLEHADASLGRARGLFRPGIGYELVQPVFQLFTQAVSADGDGVTDPDKLDVLDTTFPHDKPQMLYWNVQSELDGERFHSVGVSRNAIHVVGNLKFDIPESAELREQGQALRGLLFAGAPVLVAASTRVGEDETVLAAFALLGVGQLRGQIPQLHRALLETIPVICRLNSPDCSSSTATIASAAQSSPRIALRIHRRRRVTPLC